MLTHRRRPTTEALPAVHCTPTRLSHLVEVVENGIEVIFMASNPARRMPSLNSSLSTAPLLSLFRWRNRSDPSAITRQCIAKHLEHVLRVIRRLTHRRRIRETSRAPARLLDPKFDPLYHSLRSMVPSPSRAPVEQSPILGSSRGDPWRLSSRERSSRATTCSLLSRRCAGLQ